MFQLIAGFMAFHSAFLKMKMVFQMRFLLIPSIKFQFQMLLGRRKKLRRDLNQWMLELWCLNNLINLENPRASFVSRRKV